MSKKRKTELLVYCGPSFTGQLQQFTVLKGSIPSYMDKHIENCPEIKNLFVPTTKLASTREKLAIEGSKENQIYKKILEHQKKESEIR